MHAKKSKVISSTTQLEHVPPSDMLRDLFQREYRAIIQHIYQRLPMASLARLALAEDGAAGSDLTTHLTIAKNLQARAQLVARHDMVIAGLGLAEAIFKRCHRRLQCRAPLKDGDAAADGTVLLAIEGPAGAILTAERPALNVLQNLSGIATQTRCFVDAVAGTDVLILDTRKTPYAMRLLSKYAVQIGGGYNHRTGLDDGILIKDNHIQMAGGISAVLRKALARSPLPVQIEVASLAQLKEALTFDIGGVLLDNMTPGQVARAVALIRRHPVRAGLWIEASGGITLDNVRQYADAGVNAISVGALTHSIRAADISLDIAASHA